jgi:hypothetical protein
MVGKKTKKGKKKFNDGNKRKYKNVKSHKSDRV